MKFKITLEQGLIYIDADLLIYNKIKKMILYYKGEYRQQIESDDVVSIEYEPGKQDKVTIL